jgi:hypothetical protein
MRKIEQFWFKYFSYSTRNSEDCWLRYMVYLILFIPSAIGVGLDILGKNGLIWIYIFCGLLIIFAIPWIIIFFYHNWRIKNRGAR